MKTDKNTTELNRLEDVEKILYSNSRVIETGIRALDQYAIASREIVNYYNNIYPLKSSEGLVTAIRYVKSMLDLFEERVHENPIGKITPVPFYNTCKDVYEILSTLTTTETASEGKEIDLSSVSYICGYSEYDCPVCNNYSPTLHDPYCKCGQKLIWPTQDKSSCKETLDNSKGATK